MEVMVIERMMGRERKGDSPVKTGFLGRIFASGLEDMCWVVGRCGSRQHRMSDEGWWYRAQRMGAVKAYAHPRRCSE